MIPYSPPRKTAFTLIELLIVVAIIAILAAIAVPNFLEAQTRAKVSRAKSDMRSVATALEAYRLDNNDYPRFSLEPQPFSLPGGPGPNPGGGDGCIPAVRVGGLTSPVAYITSIPNDPFGDVLSEDLFNFGGAAQITDTYYFNTRGWFECRGFPWLVSPQNSDEGTAEWVLLSKGPNKLFAPPPPEVTNGVDHVDRPFRWQYDPTNGTISAGNIVRAGP